jgi:hypothetical protein
MSFKTERLVFSADGFNCKDEKAAERLVESFEISSKSAGSGHDDTDLETRRVSVDKEQLTYLGGIVLGIEYLRVTRLLETKGITPVLKDNTLTWQEQGYEHLRSRTDDHDELTYTTWTSRLTFRNNKLEDICIECD